MRSNRIFTLFNIGLFLILLSTSQAWMFWHTSTMMSAMLDICSLLLGWWYLSKHHHLRNRSPKIIPACFFLIIAFLWNSEASLLGVGYLIIYVALWGVVMSYNSDGKNNILQFQTKALALFLTISLVAWLVNFVYPLPNGGYISRDENIISYTTNYYLFISSGTLDIRFRSVFLEPGHLGCITTFFIMVNRFDFRKKEVVALTVVLFFTLSFAGYVLFIIGYALNTLNANKRSKIVSRLLIGLLVLIIGVQISKTYNGGRNDVNEQIMERISHEGEGYERNQRYSKKMENKFIDMVSSGEIFLGLSNSDYMKVQNGDTSAGCIPYLIYKGILGTLCLFMGYFIIALDSKYRKWAMCVFLLYSISFFQRTYFSWASYLLPFICGTALPDYRNFISASYKNNN